MNRTGTFPCHVVRRMIEHMNREGTISGLADKAGISRQKLYDMMGDPETNPTWSTLTSLLDTLGYRVLFERKWRVPDGCRSDLG